MEKKKKLTRRKKGYSDFVDPFPEWSEEVLNFWSTNIYREQRYTWSPIAHLSKDRIGRYYADVERGYGKWAVTLVALEVDRRLEAVAIAESVVIGRNAKASANSSIAIGINAGCVSASEESNDD